MTDNQLDMIVEEKVIVELKTAFTGLPIAYRSDRRPIEGVSEGNAVHVIHLRLSVFA